MPMPSAFRLVASIAPNLIDSETKAVVALSRCVPLLLKMVASALVAGRIDMQVFLVGFSIVHFPVSSVPEMVCKVLYFILLSCL